MKHFGPISGLAIHQGLVATAGYDNQILLWDAISGETIARGMHDHLVNHCAFSNDGSLLVSASSDYSARIWEIPTMRLKAVLHDHADDVDMAVFSPDDQYIASCALDRSVRIFTNEGRCLKVFRGHTGNVLSLTWSRDGSRLFSSSVDGTIREWDVSGDAQPKVHELGIRTDTLAMDSQARIFAGDDHGRIARIENGNITFTQAHKAGIKKLVFDEERHVIITLSYDRTLAIWDIDADGQPHEKARTTCPNPVWARSAAILQDGRIAVGTFGGRYAIYDRANDAWDLEAVVAGAAIDAIISNDAHTYTVGDSGQVHLDGMPLADMGSLCNFLVDAGDMLFTGGQLGELYDARTGKVLYTHHSPLNCGVAFSRNNGTEFVVGTYTGELLHFRIGEEHQLALLATLHVFSNAVKGVAVDSDTLFVVCANTSFARYSISDMQQREFRPKAHDRIANACCSLGDGNFASIGRDRTLRLWLASGDEQYESPHVNSVKCMAVSKDHRVLMTGSYRGLVAAFDLVERKWLSPIQPTAAGISSMTWDEKTSRFLAASYDGNVYPVSV